MLVLCLVFIFDVTSGVARAFARLASSSFYCPSVYIPTTHSGAYSATFPHVKQFMVLQNIRGPPDLHQLTPAISSPKDHVYIFFWSRFPLSGSQLNQE